MKISIAAFTIFIFFTFTWYRTEAQPCKISKLSIAAGSNMNKENFRWSIAGNEQGTNPNVYSELIFKPVWSAGFYIAGDYQFLPRVYAGISYSRANTFSGRGTDTDYSGDNRTSSFYTGNFDSNKGSSQKLSASVSYTFFQRRFFKTKAALGYGSYKQQFYLLSMSIPNLNTSYIAKWHGPSTFINTTFTFRKFSSDLFFSYHLLIYKGDANWNINELFQHPHSFRQNAIGSGAEAGISLNYAISPRLKVDLGSSILKFRTQTGTDEAFLADGSSVRTLFNGALRKNLQLSAGVTYGF